jgi:hypothetical protein
MISCVKKTTTDAADHKRFRSIIWLLPSAYVLHIVEEYVGGFPVWVTQVVGGSFNNIAFALNNAAFMMILLMLTAWTTRSTSRIARLLLITWASANVFWDGLFHIVATALYDRYSPGEIIASILYLPISLAIAYFALRSRLFTPGTFPAAVAAGGALFAFVVWYGLFHFAT